MRFLSVAMIVVGASAVGAAAAHAEDLEGAVLTVGTTLNREVMLLPPKADKGPGLCANDVMKRVGKLSGMTVRASGAWHGEGKKRCFEASDFAVVKTSSGRDAVVGTLEARDGGFAIGAANGQSYTLADVPGGLKKLVGQKVILDLKPLAGSAGAAGKYVVVSYGSHP
jgi:hypothetical protein